MNRGDTFLWDPDGGNNSHLFIVVTQPRPEDGRFVVFNLTRSSGGGGWALTFRIGEHPFITKYDSDINYGDGLITDLARVLNDISRRRAKPHSPMSQDQIDRIARHAVGHPAVPGSIVKMVQADLARRAVP